MAKADLTAQRLRELLDYNPETGVFTRRSGTPAVLHVNQSGSRQISLDRRLYSANKIAWMWVRGEIPSGQVLHLDGNKGNLAAGNLRLSTEHRSSLSLRDLFTYCQETGEFTNKISRNRTPAGTRAGSVGEFGYVYLSAPGRGCLRAHRVAWELVTGSPPDGDIDHINGDKSDNRWANLRSVDKRTNAQNMRRARADNLSTGVLGVSVRRRDGKFVAQIQDADGVKRTLGAFETVVEASDAYISAKRALHDGCTI